jgi:hypothetical protein
MRKSVREKATRKNWLKVRNSWQNGVKEMKENNGDKKARKQTKKINSNR